MNSWECLDAIVIMFKIIRVLSSNHWITVIHGIVDCWCAVCNAIRLALCVIRLIRRVGSVCGILERNCIVVIKIRAVHTEVVQMGNVLTIVLSAVIANHWVFIKALVIFAEIIRSCRINIVAICDSNSELGRAIGLICGIWDASWINGWDQHFHKVGLCAKNKCEN